jgi:hypothetical protein
VHVEVIITSTPLTSLLLIMLGPARVRAGRRHTLTGLFSAAKYQNVKVLIKPHATSGCNISPLPCPSLCLLPRWIMLYLNQLFAPIHHHHPPGSLRCTGCSLMTVGQEGPSVTGRGLTGGGRWWPTAVAVALQIYYFSVGGLLV